MVTLAAFTRLQAFKVIIRGRREAISFVMVQHAFLQEYFHFLHRKCINLQKGSLRNKMYFDSILKGVFVFNLDQL